MKRAHLKKLRRSQKKTRVRVKRAINERTATLAEVMAPLHPDLAALGDPLFPPPPMDPADRFASAMIAVARRNLEERLKERNR